MGLKSRFKSLLHQTSTPTMLPTPFLLLPLYIFPTPTAWTPLYDALAAHPNLNMTIVVNPDSGPGSTAYPESDYVAGLTKLNTFPNVNLLGYVHVLSTTRDISDVKADIDTYAGWAGYSDGNIAVSGIFFDEAPNDYSGDAYAYMQEAATYARATLPSISNSTPLTAPTSRPRIIFNPGTVVDSRFFSLADNIVVFEDYAENFDSVDSLEAVPKAVRAKSSVILHDFGGDAGDLGAAVKCVRQSGIPGLFISDAEYDSWGNNWDAFVGDLSGF